MNLRPLNTTLHPSCHSATIVTFLTATHAVCAVIVSNAAFMTLMHNLCVCSIIVWCGCCCRFIELCHNNCVIIVSSTIVRFPVGRRTVGNIGLCVWCPSSTGVHHPDDSVIAGLQPPVNGCQHRSAGRISVRIHAVVCHTGSRCSCAINVGCHYVRPELQCYTVCQYHYQCWSHWTAGRCWPVGHQLSVCRSQTWFVCTSLSYGDCLEVKKGYYQNSSVLDCITQCLQSAAHLRAVFTGRTDWVCHSGTLTPCVEAVA